MKYAEPKLLLASLALTLGLFALPAAAQQGCADSIGLDSQSWPYTEVVLEQAAAARAARDGCALPAPLMRQLEKTLVDESQPLGAVPVSGVLAASAAKSNACVTADAAGNCGARLAPRGKGGATGR